MSLYRCPECDSTNIEGSLPCWVSANDNADMGSLAEPDWEADYTAFYCQDCQRSDHASIAWHAEEEGDDS